MTFPMNAAPGQPPPPPTGEWLAEWLDVDAVARMTRDVNRLIFLPVILITLSALSWLPQLDDWPLHPIVVVLFGLSLPLCVIGAILLRRVARRVQKNALRRLERYRTSISPDDDASKTMISRLITEIEDVNSGVFVPWFQDPVFQSILLPAFGFISVELAAVIEKVAV